jgi:hypothetical protein
MTQEVRMSEQIHASGAGQEHNPQETLTQEAEEVIAALRELGQRVSSPVIRECLETARFDIAYLASTGDDVIADRFDDDDEAEEEG